MKTSKAAMAACLVGTLAACGGGGGSGGESCVGDSPDPCQQLVNGEACLLAKFTNCTTSPAAADAVQLCDEHITPCDSSDQSQIDQLALCLSNIPGGDCSQDGTAVIEQESAAEEDCFGSLSLSSACQSSLDLTFDAWGQENESGTCPAAPEDLTGTGAAGTPCTDETQCEPACCSCPNGYPAQFLAADCQNEKCVAASSVCSVVAPDLAGSANDPCP
ncbi:MAG TPA: hypothetical protein VMB50_19790 [Myxococcales bacterium]|nr:hypothetical protein [Myxococcales bacterium]